MEADVVNAGNRWIPDAEYQNIKAKVPILCVDVLLTRIVDRQSIGLIYRDTYAGGHGWCLIGGAVLRDEPLADALARHVEATLGCNFSVVPASIQMRMVAEYFTERRAGQLHDPRKHAVALTYSGLCEGEPEPTGEALDFRWFKVSELAGIQFGFGQGDVVRQVLASPGIDMGER